MPCHLICLCAFVEVTQIYYSYILLHIRPAVRFSSNEDVACRLATNEIQFFDAGDFSKGVVYRIRLPGIAALELSKAPASYVAAFVPESKVISTFQLIIIRRFGSCSHLFSECNLSPLFCFA